MMLRSAAVVAGLALGLMSGAAKAAPITYNVDYSIDGQSVTGFIQTDGFQGSLSRSNITNYDLLFGTSEANNTNSYLILSGSGIVANYNQIAFNFDGNSHVEFNNVNSGELTFTSNNLLNINNYTFYSNGDNPAASASAGSSVLIGTVSAVPLPASAPMFGAALLGLAGLGYAAKRKAKITA